MCFYRGQFEQFLNFFEKSTEINYFAIFTVNETR